MQNTSSPLCPKSEAAFSILWDDVRSRAKGLMLWMGCKRLRPSATNGSWISRVGHGQVHIQLDYFELISITRAVNCVPWIQVIESNTGEGGALPKKSGRGVRPASQNSYSSLNFIRFFPLPRGGAGEKRLNSERYNVVRWRHVLFWIWKVVFD